MKTLSNIIFEIKLIAVEGKLQNFAKKEKNIKK